MDTKMTCWRVWVVCLAMAGAGAAMSSTLAYACSSSGCSGGCKVATKWCVNSTDTGWDFGASGVVRYGSCSPSPGGAPYDMYPRSYDIYGECDNTCSSDEITPGTIPAGTREGISQDYFYTVCQVGS